MSSKIEEQVPAAAAAANDNDDDDDSENDDDYVPDETMEDEDDEGAISQEVGLKGPYLSAAKRKAVDEAFENLFGYPFGTTFQPKRRRQTETTTAAATTISKRERILSDIFGPSTAARLMATSSSVRVRERKHASLPLTVDKTITEIKRFAGKDIAMQRTIAVDRSSSAKATEETTTSTTADGNANEDTAALKPSLSKPAAAAGGLDSVLADIAGPSKLSTVAKTSADWDAYKTKTGVEQVLEQQAQSNKAYLVKQDFLSRVDKRRFEHEREQRDRERAARK